jgi:hypothetical protein
MIITGEKLATEVIGICKPVYERKLIRDIIRCRVDMRDSESFTLTWSVLLCNY